MKAAVRGAAAVPELEKYRCPFGVKRSCGLLPTRYLRVVVYAWRIHPAKALLGNNRGFSDDQSGRGALGIIFGHQLVRDPFASGASASERRHNNAIAKG